MVASDSTMLSKDKADLWNSGKIGSSSSVLVAYQGKELKSGSAAYWKIRIWDQTGKVSSWSPVAQFSVGLLNKEDWQAAYIGFPTNAGFNECPLLKKTFLLDNIDKRMFLYVNSLGYHEVYLNGIKVGDGVLSPAVSQFNKRSQVITYDISSLVRKGHNELVLWLGSGWYTEGLPGVVNNGPLVKAQLEKLSENQRKIILATDATWLGRKSSYTRQGNWRPHQFGGEVLNGALAQKDLSGENAESGSWSPVSVISVPNYEVSPQMVEPNRITETILPARNTAAVKRYFPCRYGENPHRLD